jgi:DNA-binding transcriptional regulator YhcF (GntR family)
MSAVVRGHYRHGSIRGAGQRVVLEKHQVGAWLYQVGQALGAGSSVYKAASALAAVIGADGRLDPTQGWIAEKIGLCRKTISRTLQKLASFGFLTWQRRVAVTAGVERQTSNAYQLRFPEAIPETPAELSTSPPSALSHNEVQSLIPEKESWDISAQSVAAKVLRAMPVRQIRAAQKALTDRARAVHEAWAAGRETRAEALRVAWSASRLARNGS